MAWQADPGRPLIPIGLHVVTGFLGAGKTTLINRLLRAPEFSDTLVIVNEFGAIGLDHLLFENVAGDVLLMASGCLCCSLRGDLIDGLHDILRRRDAGELAPFSRIVLETSGLADPAPILHALLADPVIAARTRLAGVTTLVDAINGAATLKVYGEARRQVAFADRIVLSKSDLVAPEALCPLRAALRDINATAPIVDLARQEFGADDFLNEAYEFASLARPTKMAAHDGSVRARAFTTEKAIEAAALARFLALLETRLGPRLLRVKGLFATREHPDEPLVVESAQHAFSPPRRLKFWPEGRQETRLVVISDGLHPAEIERLWRALMGAPEIDQPDLAALTENPLAPRRGGLLG
jgi:G3E family GTPase